MDNFSEQEAGQNGRPLITQPPPVQTAPMSPLSPLIQAVKAGIEPGSIGGSVFTTITSMVGPGCLAVPFLFKTTGIATGIVMIVVFALATIFNLRILIMATRRLDKHSYLEITEAAWGKRASQFTTYSLIFSLVGGAVAFLVVIRDLFPLALAYAFQHKCAHPFLGHDYCFSSEVATWITIAISACLIFPLSLMHDMRKLSFTSMFSLAFFCYLVGVVTIKFFVMCADQSSGECFRSMWSNSPELPLGSWSLAKISEAVPFCIGVFAAHMATLPIYGDLQQKSPQRMFRVVNIALCLASCIYIPLGVFAFATFKQDTQGNFLLNDYNGDPTIWVGALLLSFNLCASVPIFIHSARRNLDAVLFNIPIMSSEAKMEYMASRSPTPRKLRAQRAARFDTTGDNLRRSLFKEPSSANSDFSVQSNLPPDQSSHRRFSHQHDLVSNAKRKSVQQPEVRLLHQNGLPQYGSLGDHTTTTGHGEDTSMDDGGGLSFCVAHKEQIRHVVVTFALVAGSVAFSILITGLAEIITLLGTTVMPFICYIIPCLLLFHMTDRGEHTLDKAIAATMLLVIPAAAVYALVIKVRSW